MVLGFLPFRQAARGCKADRHQGPRRAVRLACCTVASSRATSCASSSCLPPCCCSAIGVATCAWKATGRGWSACRRDPCLAVNLMVVISCATKTALLTCCATISPEKASPGSPGSLRSQRSSMCSAPGRAAGPEDASAGAPATGVIVIATAGHFRAAASSASSAAIREARWEARNLSAAFCSRHSRFDSSCLSLSATSSACAALRSASPGGGWPRKSAFAAQGELREVTVILGSPRRPSVASDATSADADGRIPRSVGAKEGWQSANVRSSIIIIIQRT